MSARTFFEILVGLWLIVVFIINTGRSSLCSLSFLAENGETFYQSIKVFVLNSKAVATYGPSPVSPKTFNHTMIGARQNGDHGRNFGQFP